MFNSILLCTHGTKGAQQAESLVFNDLVRKNPHLKVTVLTIIDQDWQSMTGDDWLNSSRTHATFLNHVEEQLGEEIREDWQRIRNQFPEAAQADFVSRVGALEEAITGTARQLGCDLIVIGSHHESRRFLNLQMEKGLRARLKNAKLHPLLPCPLLIAP
jgi:nucleotide-binding universal stress UspA family protein